VPVLKDGAEAASRSGNPHLAVFSLHIIRHTHTWTEASSVENDSADQELKKSLEIGDRKSIGWGAYGKAEALARAGRFVDASAYLQLAYRQFTEEIWYGTQPVCQGVHGYLLLQLSLARAATKTLGFAWETVVKSRNFHSFCCYGHALYLESVVGARWLDAGSPENIAIARRLNRWTPVLFAAYRSIQVPLLRSSGRLAALRGKHRRAIRKFKRALRLTESRGMPYFKARVLLDLAAIQEQERHSRRSEAIRLLKRMESVIPRAESWLLGDQYDEAVVAPEFDLESWEREHGKIASLAGSDS
jgi:tetratricopeptide (TPR) repeat protein